MNKVIVRFADGRMIKGMTSDFFPAKDFFHVSLKDAAPGDEPVKVHTSEMKALFFVKDYAGNPEYRERGEFDPEHPTAGRHIRVEFRDGEVLTGTTTGYNQSRPGFFLEPADPDSNNERCFVVTAATRDISFI